MRPIHLFGIGYGSMARKRPAHGRWTLLLPFLTLVWVLHAGGCAHGTEDSADRPLRSGQENLNVDRGSGLQETIHTCSMHPGVRQIGPGDCPICGMDLIPAADGGRGTFGDESLDADTRRASGRTHDGLNPGAHGAFPRMAQAVLVEPAIAWSGPGRLEADPSRTHVVSLDAAAFVVHSGGWIIGDEVGIGDLLMEVESSELTGAARELALLSGQTLDGTDRTSQVASDLERRLRRAWVSPEQIQRFREGETRGDTLRIESKVEGVVIRAVSGSRQSVQAREELFALNDLAELIADVDVFDVSAADILPGDTVDVRLLAGSGGAVKGIVHSVRPLQAQSGYALGVRVRVPNPGRELREGMRVAATGTSVSREPGVHIPVSSVLWTGETSWVFKKNGERIEAAPVVLGARLEELVHVVEGVSEGEEVVLNGTFLLDSTEQLSGARSRFAFTRAEGPTLTGTRSLLDGVDVRELLNQYERWTASLAASSVDSANEGMHQTLAMLEDNVRSEIFRIEKVDRRPARITLEENRRLYKRASDLLIDALPHGTGEGEPSESVYVQYCPMAFGDQGARWLSFDREILNPYFGDAMLRCGETVDLVNFGSSR